MYGRPNQGPSVFWLDTMIMRQHIFDLFTALKGLTEIGSPLYAETEQLAVSLSGLTLDEVRAIATLAFADSHPLK